VETSSLEGPLVSNVESQESSIPLPSPIVQVKSRRAQPRGMARHQPRIVRERQKSIKKVYDRPGKKPAAEYEPDPIKLEALCRLRGGTEFACQWILRAFEGGVTLGALVRGLKLTEVESMNFQGGFEPYLVYDGFLQKAEDEFECCLCAVGKRVTWKNKKDSVRHLRKFHFGLADQCITWCVMYHVSMYLSRFSDQLALFHSHKSIYSTGEMNSHRCAPLHNPAHSGHCDGTGGQF
jgi:hypothetical protein